MTTTTGGAARALREVVEEEGSEPAPLRWVSRGSLVVTLLAVLALYTWDLSASGYANSFYSAAAQAGSQSWKAFLFGSLDAGNSITVDKTPASLWLMALSVRIFGLSSWSILLPQALLGVASAAVLYASVRRALTGPATTSWQVGPTRAHWAGIVAALTMALTPAATLMFRFNNPDALMVFCYVAASYFTIRATETASRTWLALTGVAIGIGFLAKMLQAFVVLPALILAYAVAAPATWRKKLLDLLTALAAMIVSFGWYIALVELVPTSWRPYIGGSQTNSILELTFGYNGLGRLNGNETGSIAAAGPRTVWGAVGWTRMFLSLSGEMASFLIPAALVLTVFALGLIGRGAYANLLRRHGATGETRALAALTLYGAWLVVNGLVFSFMAGIYHAYYTVALAPAIGGSVALGGAVLWTRRSALAARAGLTLAAVVTAFWAVDLTTLAGRLYVVVAGIAALALFATAAFFLLGRSSGPRARRTALVIATAASLLAPASYSIQTALTAHTGSIVTAGPLIIRITDPRAQPGRAGSAPGPGGITALIDGTPVSSEMVTTLSHDAGRYTWVAATTGSQNSASYQLATGYPVMAIGGFYGSDPSPTLTQFQRWVAQRRIHYYIVSASLGRSESGSDASARIGTWVTQNFTPRAVGATTVYDLTQEK